MSQHDQKMTTQRIHILGICGTFMGGLAMIARELGYEVSGTDANVYPPMSTQLEESGIQLFEGYKVEHLDSWQENRSDNISGNGSDLVIVGNAMSRGNPMVEAVLDRGISYTSGPQWLADAVLKDRWVLAVAGTHGKTTTTSMLAWILEDAKLYPGFLIGGVAENFGLSARLGEEPFFVIEADEYDTAFFDKRSKFVHYRPRTAILNNLEFDHADIFDDLDAIKRQFHHLIRTVPGTGQIIYPKADQNLQDVLEQGCWSETQTIVDEPDRGSDEPDQEQGWSLAPVKSDYSKFSVTFEDKTYSVDWPMIGRHNALNAVAAIIAARHVGVTPDIACEALGRFESVKRRLECIGEVNNIRVYDDFAHHPTAIKTTLEAMRQHVGKARVISILEPRSNTMKMGVHQHSLGQSLEESDQCFVLQSDNLDWDLHTATINLGERCQVFSEVDSIVAAVAKIARTGDHIVIMSNGSFEGIHGKILSALHES